MSEGSVQEIGSREGSVQEIVVDYDESNKSEPMYLVSREQETQLAEIVTSLKQICRHAMFKVSVVDLKERVENVHPKSDSLAIIVSELKTHLENKGDIMDTQDRTDNSRETNVGVLRPQLCKSADESDINSVRRHHQDAQERLGMIKQVEDAQQVLRSILIDHVLQVAYKLKRERFIEVPPLGTF